VKIGVLALQGDFREHIQMLRRLGLDTVEVRLPADLELIDGLVIPGGESTTIGKLLVGFNLIEPLRRRALDGFPIYGTCAGAIVLANQVTGRGVDQPLIGVMDVSIQRNAFGRQVASFEADVAISALGNRPFHAVFIRAPVIQQAGSSVDVLGRLEDGTIVAAQQGNLLATSFHPELTGDDRLHHYFASVVENRR
jgi:pyridoxal 5'-phosphate synthase pdxT subunit